MQANPPVQRPGAAIAITSEPASGLRPLLMPASVLLPPARRLIVLVPELDLDETALARRIWNLAAPNKLAVLYLALSPSAADEPHARRQLATLAALTRDEQVTVNTALAVETDWVSALRPLQRSGDLAVCHLEQTAPSWRGAQPLGQALCQSLRIPVHLLEGFYAGDPAKATHPAPPLMFWGGAVVILACAFWLEVQISTLPKNWVEGALMAFAVVAECGLIGWWSRGFN
jgi:hypothetical protein